MFESPLSGGVQMMLLTDRRAGRARTAVPIVSLMRIYRALPLSAGFLGRGRRRR